MSVSLDRIDTVILDLDGTLVDSADGILGSLRAAFAELGVPEPPGGLGSELLGPPMHATLPSLVGDAIAPELLLAFRRYYVDSGWQVTKPYPGIEALLNDLAGAGLRLAVATSKQELTARLIIERHGWTDLFATVCGDTPDAERPTKAAVIGETLDRLGASVPVMVGDRKYDVAGALTHDLACIGAGWGYGVPGELAAAGALVVCEQPTDVLGAIRPGSPIGPWPAREKRPLWSDRHQPERATRIG